MSDIVERLHNQATKRQSNAQQMSDGTMVWYPMMNEAADTIEALRAENARLLKVLSGLVDVAQYCDGINTSEQLRAARAAMGESDD